jgi:peptidoglycan/xylan/chitin deacetylase (PgdA/CDA1 family)
VIPIPLRTLAGLAYPGGRRARLNVLFFHRVPASPDPLAPSLTDVATFRRLMEDLGRHFRVLPLADAVRQLFAGGLPPRSLCISFDDGYLDNLENAAPVLRSLGLPATVFVATGFLARGIMWNDRIIEAVRQWGGGEIDLSDLGLGRHRASTTEQRRDLIGALLAALKRRGLDERDRLTQAVSERLGAGEPPRLMLRPEELGRLARDGIEVGAHTVNHPILSRVPLAQAREEIVRGKAELEDLLGVPVPLFAYPNGRRGQDYGPEHVDLVRHAGFDAAFSTASGVATADADRFELPRFTPWDHTPVRFTTRLLIHGLRPGLAS